LRRQEDSSAAEKADFVRRLATAEQQAAESEQRVATAERQVTAAQVRVAEIESALRDTESKTDTDGGSRIDADAEIDGTGAGTEAGTEPATVGRPQASPGQPDPVEELSRETVLLRTQLADAEGRAAKFSSRLAMARTEAEDAQRQVATMTTRLDRHQAEW